MLFRSLSDLTAKFNDITTKYKALCQNVTNQLENFRHTQQQRILTEGQEKQKTDERLLNEYNSARMEVEQSFAEKIATATGIIDSIKSEQNDCDKELLKLQYLSPFKKEQEALSQQVNELSLKEKELEGKITSLTSEINRIMAEYDKKERSEEHTSELQSPQ